MKVHHTEREHRSVHCRNCKHHKVSAHAVLTRCTAPIPHSYCGKAAGETPTCTHVHTLVSMFCPLKQAPARYSASAVAASVSLVTAAVALHTCSTMQMSTQVKCPHDNNSSDSSVSTQAACWSLADRPPFKNTTTHTQCIAYPCAPNKLQPQKAFLPRGGWLSCTPWPVLLHSPETQSP